MVQKPKLPKPAIPDVLADRYASREMCEIWSEEGKVIRERQFWIAVLKAQRELGMEVPEGVIEAYEKVAGYVDLASIRAREAITRHDVKARIEEFCALAGFEYIHRGMTSRDLTDNVEQLQIRESMQLVFERMLSVLDLMMERAVQYDQLYTVARTHLAAAQVTTFGKRISSFTEELLIAVKRLENLLDTYALRGIKGPVGTMLDQSDLLGGPEKARELDQMIAKHLGFKRTLSSVGQVYPRSMDLEVVSNLVQLAAGPTNFANSLRLMAGNELATEGFKEGQVGSSAMPHKMNGRTSERTSGFNSVLKGYETMVSNLSGTQWFEGDVSCSVVRRVALPGAFFATDGLIESFMTILLEMGVFPAVIEKELIHFLPFLSTTRVLVESTKRGVGREAVHEAIKEHAIKVALSLRDGEIAANDLAERLAQDERIPLTLEEIKALADPNNLSGDAVRQVRLVRNEVNKLLRVHLVGKVRYRPDGIL